MTTVTPAKGIPPTLDSLKVPIDSLKPYSKNPRQGDVGAIVESLRWHGQYRPIVVNKRTTEVLAGNHTLRAALELGWTEIAATFVDVDEDTAARIVLVDNRSNDLAAYDDAALLALLHSLPTLDGTGFDGDALDELLADLGDGGSPGSDTDPIEPPEEPRTVPGTVYTLGDHRLVCGDSTDQDVIVLATDSATASLMVTDPPYGVAYQADLSPEEAKRLRRRTDGREVKNDGQDGTDTAEVVAAALARAPLEPGAAYYVFCPPGPNAVVDAMQRAGLDPRHSLAWIKDRFVLGRSDYHYRHEQIIYGWAPGAAHYFVDDRTQDTVWEFARPSRSEEHPTMKPVPLLERAIGNSSRPGDLVYEPFCGSGSTLIACENLGRRCAAIELDPAYCDVIVDRWERHTGKKASLDG